MDDVIKRLNDIIQAQVFGGPRVGMSEVTPFMSLPARWLTLSAPAKRSFPHRTGMPRSCSPKSAGFWFRFRIPRPLPRV